MAAKTGTVWAIDIGNSSLKALRLSTERGVLEAVGFENIRHGKNLSGSGVKDAEREELVALSLRKFVNKHDLTEDEIVVSVPSQNSFARFVKLPPVDNKRIPEIVRFEAVQQIPFDINEVQWDWQRMSEEGSPELKVGIFAIKNDVVESMLEHFNREDIQVSYVQMAPMALYNYVLYDRRELFGSENQATVVLNIGAETTDLVVCTSTSVWQRCILIGGNTFTKAIADTFRLNFEKAEKLKRTAPMSKYARQIFQAMRPVFTDLASEIQRSLGFYTSSNPSTKTVRMIALGGGTKMRGLLKYLQQTLQMPVERPDSFKRLAIGGGVSAAKFHESVCDFGVIYGLALQGLDLATIESNLLPRSIARSLAWASKGRWFIAAAAMLLTVSLMCFARTGWDRLRYAKEAPTRVSTERIVDRAGEARSKLDEEQRKGAEYQATIDKHFAPFEYRRIVPFLNEVIVSILPNEKNNPKQAALYRAFAGGDVQGVRAVPRKQRKQIFLTSMSINYASELAGAQYGGAELWRRSRGRPGRGGMEDGSADVMMDEMAYEMMLRSMRSGQRFDPRSFSAAQTTGQKAKSGFVVTVVGYSPYGQLAELLDPPGVEDSPDRWGVVTRLMHLHEALGDAVDANSFEVYERAVECRVEDVRMDAEMPPGLGVVQARYPGPQTATGEPGGKAEWVLTDPMTGELMSKVPVLDKNGKPTSYGGEPVFEINDHWFVLNFKLLWKDAPEIKTETAPAYSGATPARQARPAASKSAPTGRKQKNTPDIGDW